MAGKRPDRQPTQAMPGEGDKHAGRAPPGLVPEDERGAGGGGPFGPGEQSEGFDGGQSVASYHGTGRLGKDKVDGRDKAEGPKSED